ncbi:hypothetical protein PVAG01_03257 [Phlyctema vagabunda]|uniref:Dynamin-type G domain-containing protein n=1 Tax=Phlyctema vagabunda TaxID=108571 RepID=A0ABR4PT11_9HELO
MSSPGNKESMSGNSKRSSDQIDPLRILPRNSPNKRPFPETWSQLSPVQVPTPYRTRNPNGLSSSSISPLVRRRQSSTWSNSTRHGSIDWTRDSPDGRFGLERHSIVTSEHERVLKSAEKLTEHASPIKIIVAGTQSSGKSSLLEGLTGLSFPINQMGCTRLPVEIILRHEPNAFPSVQASRISHSAVGEVGMTETIIEKTHFLSKDAFDTQGFRALFDKAAQSLGALDWDALLRFSDDTFRVEISGPEYEDLYVVDLPGLFDNTALYQTEKDSQIVHALSRRYMDEENNIILVVVDATNIKSDKTEKLLRMARSADPTGIRTVGVITKLDLLLENEIANVASLARNEVVNLQNGWFVVKNRSRKEVARAMPWKQRNMNEATYLLSYPWNTLDTSRVGTPALKLYLSELVAYQSRLNLVELAKGFTSLAAQAQLALEDHQIESKTSEKVLELKNWDFDINKRGITSVGEISSDEIDLEANIEKKRPIKLLSCTMVAMTLFCTLTLLALGARAISNQITIDGSWIRMAFITIIPLQFFIALFFVHSAVQDLMQVFGPVSQMTQNSKFYSALTTARLNPRHGALPHVTIQCPVYKEGLKGVIIPTVDSLEAAMETYRKQGGTVSLFYNDDGMQAISPEEAQERREYYAKHDIGWVARPNHNANPKEGQLRFIRKGKFKKASNMNYALRTSIRVEQKLVQIERDSDWDDTLEDKAYQNCLSEVLDEDGGRTWAGGNIRIGDYILIVDSDTRVPSDCLLDAVSEMEACPRVGIIQFSCGVMNVTTSYFERGITFFTNLVYTAIRYAVAAGDVSPFVGHNAIIRWSAIQETSFLDEEGEEKFWSESHVSEDFDLALRMQTDGYVVRLAAWAGDGFKEGVSLTVYDELARWEKYAYGCNEMVFHPIKYWLVRGPFTPLIKKFATSSMPIGSKVTISAYICTYYAIGYSWFASVMNYVLLLVWSGYLDHYYVDSFKVYFATICVFGAAGNLALAVLRYRVENRSFISTFIENLKWVVFMGVFLGGISIHVSQAILCHLFSIDMTWGATSKEAEDTSFFIELPRIMKQFRNCFIFCIVLIAMLICGAYVVPPLWQVRWFTAIWPLVTIIAGHLFLPLVLNPALMMFTF